MIEAQLLGNLQSITKVVFILLQVGDIEYMYSAHFLVHGFIDFWIEQHLVHAPKVVIFKVFISLLIIPFFSLRAL
jgi:hypothetical protein